MIRTQLKAVSLRVLSFHDFCNLNSVTTMNDGKIGTMKVLDSFQRERCTIYLFVTFFNTVTNILICGCIVFDLHLLSYFSSMHQPDVNYAEEMKLNFAEPIFSTRIVRYR
ncbi:unnamed protein product [Porites evermanni]|uniref:Uncharacterized protein n=1 Tax=Porites evermanni TaxID=104178 RepID=A0ABN8REX1_9CNID|nr:unnamed protein product [Porites evermanni]